MLYYRLFIDYDRQLYNFTNVHTQKNTSAEAKGYHGQLTPAGNS